MTKKEYYERICRGAVNFVKEYPELFTVVKKNYIIDRGYANPCMTTIEKDEAVDYRLARSYRIRGEAHAEKGKTDKAIADFTEAIRLNPRSSDAYYNRGIAYADKGDTDKAVSDFTEAVGIDPYMAEAYYNRGLVYRKNGDIAKAVDDFIETLRSGPNSGAAKKAKEALAKLNAGK